MNFGSWDLSISRKQRTICWTVCQITEQLGVQVKSATSSCVKLLLELHLTKNFHMLCFWWFFYFYFFPVWEFICCNAVIDVFLLCILCEDLNTSPVCFRIRRSKFKFNSFTFYSAYVSCVFCVKQEVCEIIWSLEHTHTAENFTYLYSADWENSINLPVPKIRLQIKAWGLYRGHKWHGPQMQLLALGD